MAPLDSRYIGVGFNLTSVQVDHLFGDSLEGSASLRLEVWKKFQHGHDFRPLLHVEAGLEHGMGILIGWGQGQGLPHQLVLSQMVHGIEADPTELELAVVAQTLLQCGEFVKTCSRPYMDTLGGLPLGWVR